MLYNSLHLKLTFENGTVPPHKICVYCREKMVTSIVEKHCDLLLYHMVKVISLMKLNNIRGFLIRWTEASSILIPAKSINLIPILKKH